VLKVVELEIALDFNHYTYHITKMELIMEILVRMEAKMNANVKEITAEMRAQ
jgi:hypothetical protein